MGQVRGGDMNLKVGELRVHYNCGWGVNVTLDRALEKILAKYGYGRWASGCDLTNGVRDLAFKPTEEDKTCAEAEVIHGDLKA